MSKVRINDLARELEVKSRSILDALTAVGVTEKKTHSSSIEEDEAEKVRGYFNRGARPSASRVAPVDTRPKFDLSHVSKPGDALKAILERKQAETAARNAPPPRPAVTVAPPVNRPAVVAARPAVAPPVAAAPVVTAAVPAPVAAAAATPAAPAPRRIVPIPRPAAPNYVVTPPAIASRPVTGPVVARPPAGTTPPAVVAVPPAEPVVVKPAAVAPAASTPVAAPAAAVAEPVAPSAPEPVAAAPAAPVANVPAPRRVVMPQTGPRPTYSAPPPPPGGPPRTPIFQRPRPGYQGNNPSGGPGGPRPGMGQGMAPGARRPMHPTRTFPTGAGGPGGPGFAPRPGFGGGPGRPGFGNRPGAAPGGLMPAPGEAPGPSRPVRAGSRGRGAPRYEKNKEVALKGYSVPRFGGPQIPQGDVPITKTITVTEGISVKDLAEKLDVRGKDLIATLLMKGVMVTVNQSLDGELVKEVSRQFGADAVVISVEEQLENEAIEGLLEDTSNMVEVVRAPVVTIMATSITVRLRCWMRSVQPMWQQVKLAELRSTSARTR